MWFTVLYTRFLDNYDFMKLSIGNIWHVQYSKFFLFIVLQVLHAKKDCYPIFIYIFNFLFFIVNVIDNKMYFYLNRFSTQRKSWISMFERFVKKLFKNNEKWFMSWRTTIVIIINLPTLIWIEANTIIIYPYRLENSYLWWYRSLTFFFVGKNSARQ